MQITGSALSMGACFPARPFHFDTTLAFEVGPPFPLGSAFHRSHPTLPSLFTVSLFNDHRSGVPFSVLLEPIDAEERGRDEKKAVEGGSAFLYSLILLAILTTF